VRDAELLDASPMTRVRRPHVEDDSATVGLDRDELGRLLSAAEADGPRSTALISLLVYNGLRISEALSRDVEHFTYQTGHRVLRLTRKGGKRYTEALAPVTVHALETYLGERSAGPLLLGRDGTGHLTRSAAWRLIRRLARSAGIPAADQLSPHSLRHSFATGLLGAGVPLQDVQDAMGHADPRTTRAYDRSRHRLDNHATYAMAAWLRRTTAEGAGWTTAVKTLAFLSKLQDPKSACLGRAGTTLVTVTSNEEIPECLWCHRQFKPPGRRGPVPTYCSAAHRQRAYEARRSAASARWATSMMAAMPPGLDATLKTLAAQAVPAGFDAKIAALAAQAMPPGLDATLKTLAAQAVPAGFDPKIAALAAQAMPPGLDATLKTLAAMIAPPAGIAEAMSQLASQWRLSDPPNWPEGAAWDDMCNLIADTGWSLIHVPRPQVITALLHAAPADRDDVLLSHAAEVVVDCRSALGTIDAAGASHLVDALGQALDAFEAGLVIPAQTTVASVLADVINRVLGLSFTAAVRELNEDPGEMPMAYVRFWLIASTIPRALTQFHCQEGDDVPERFNRHAVAHTVDPRQYTKFNALIGLMLATGLVCEIAEDAKAELPLSAR